jgi:hypothetical protein
VLEAISFIKPALLGPVTVEALATLHVAKFIRDLALQKIILVGDVTSIVKKQ